jgi:formate dehydrogenase major subunit
MAMLQLILGNIGVPGRRHERASRPLQHQGLTDIGLMSNLLPGYLTIPNQKEVDLATYMKTRASSRCVRTR